MKKLSQKVFGRIAVTAALILIQAAWLLVWFTRLAHYAPWVGAVFTALSILIVLYIVRKDDNPAYKIVWIILILLVPLLGGLLYVVFGNKRPERRMREKFARAMKGTRPLLGAGQHCAGQAARARARHGALCGGMRRVPRVGEHIGAVLPHRAGYVCRHAEGAGGRAALYFYGVFHHPAVLWHVAGAFWLCWSARRARACRCA